MCPIRRRAGILTAALRDLRLRSLLEFYETGGRSRNTFQLMLGEVPRFGTKAPPPTEPNGVWRERCQIKGNNHVRGQLVPRRRRRKTSQQRGWRSCAGARHDRLPPRFENRQRNLLCMSDAIGTADRA